MMTSRTILCLNAGSSSLKYGLFRHRAQGLERIRRGNVEHGGSNGRQEMEKAVLLVMEELAADATPALAAVGHRVVHGGERYTKPVRIDDHVLAHLREMVWLAPEHQPGALAGIEAVRRIDPALPQVACFDTAFHQAMPERAKRFALPEDLWQSGVRRYGFHGLSYEHVSSVLGAEIPARTIIAHLGNGSSLAALRDGRPVETTMGFTPNSGLVMGSRCGDLEPGVVLHLLRAGDFGIASLATLLNTRSGLLGVSGLSSDMRRLLEEAAHDEQARRAIDLFCYAARKHIGAFVAVLGGLDLLVFTGGIGENSAEIRERITKPLRSYLDFNEQVIATDEEQVVARHTVELCEGNIA